MALFTNDTDPFNDGSLVAGYNLDGNATDYVGIKDGTPTSMTYASSPLNQEGVFDGTASKIDIDAYSETLVSSTIPFSISFFATLNELKCQNLISFGGATNGFTICQFSTLDFGFAGNSSGVNTQKSSGVTPSLSTKYHIVLARIGTGTTYNMYIDKTLAASALSVPFSDGSDLDLIGGNEQDVTTGTSLGTTFRLNGKLDQVMFFNREIIQSEVDLLADMVTPVASGIAVRFNGVEMTQVFFNGVEMTEVYFNGTLTQ